MTADSVVRSEFWLGGTVPKDSQDIQVRVADLRSFSTALTYLAEQAPERTTSAQMAFFILAGIADAAGKPATFTEIKEEIGPAINKSLHTTYKVSLDREQRRSDTDAVRQGLGWLTREEDPIDNRRKYLRLTSKGRDVLRDLGLRLSPRNWDAGVMGS
jgi:hypothetical protein